MTDQQNTARATDPLADQLEHAGDYADAWLFEKDGAVIIGEVVGFGEFDAGFGLYPIINLRLEDGTERSVHCQREVLQQELAKQRPQLGERLGIKYLGQPEGKRYHRYVVRVDRPQETAFDWTKYDAGAAPIEEPRRAAAPAPASAHRGAEASVWRDDEDIPFWRDDEDIPF